MKVSGHDWVSDIRKTYSSQRIPSSALGRQTFAYFLRRNKNAATETAAMMATGIRVDRIPDAELDPPPRLLPAFADWFCQRAKSARIAART